jgi:hypothetical protein
MRGRTQVLRDLEDAAFEHRLDGAAGERPEAAADPGRTPDPRQEAIAAFPFLYSAENSRPAGAGSEETRFLELLWPLFEAGQGRLLDAAGAVVESRGTIDAAGTATGRALAAPPAVSRYFRLRPFLAADDFRRSSRRILFPFYFRIREELESGTREIDHFWPFYGVHREPIDLAPATTHHVLYPLFYWRTGPERWKLSLLPVLAVSRGYVDRGLWLIPVVKSGAHGRSRFFYLLDPLLVYESLSSARGPEDDIPEKRRTRFLFLGGLIGWETDRGAACLRLLWWLRI